MGTLPQTYVCGLASRWTVKPTLTTAHSGYCWGLCTPDGDDWSWVSGRGWPHQKEDAPKSILFFKPMSWLGQIRTHRRDEVWSASLWQTLFVMTMGTQLPVIAEKSLTTCGCRKFQLDTMGDHLCTCTSHSGVKKAHDWVVEQLVDLFHTTHHTKTQHVTKSRGRHCGDVPLVAYLVNTSDPVPLVLDLRIDHDRFGSSSGPSLGGHLHYPIDKSDR